MSRGLWPAPAQGGQGDVVGVTIGAVGPRNVREHGRGAAAGLLVRAGRGDEAAFAMLYDELAGLVYGVCRRVLRDPVEAEDAAQEAFVEIWRTAARFDPAGGSARSWCVTIAHARAVDRVRSAERRRAREDKAAVRDREPDRGDVVADEVTTRLEAERVRRALDVLPPAQRESLFLAYFGGHSHSEISRMLDVPLGTVKTRIRDAIGRLRHLVPVDEGGSR